MSRRERKDYCTQGLQDGIDDTQEWLRRNAEFIVTCEEQNI